MKVALWGPRSAGKTTYIAMVYGASILSDDYRWIIRPTEVASMAFVEENFDKIRNGEFPQPTTVFEPTLYRYLFMPGIAKPKQKFGNREEDPIMRFHKWLLASNDDVAAEHSSARRQIVTEFADVSGEAYLEQDSDSVLWSHLASCDGLICLLDPSDANDHFKITFRLLQYLWLKLQKENPQRLVNGMLPHYIAFCFSKMDLPEFREDINNPEHVLQRIQSRDALNIDKLLRQFVLPSRLKYFTISAIGTEAGFEDGRIQNPRELKPINVLEPLHWLFKMSDK